MDAPLSDQSAAAAGVPPAIAEWVAGSHALALLQTALSAGLVDASRTPQTVAEIASALGAERSRVAAVCAALEAHGVLASEHERFQVTEPFARLLAPDAPVSLADMLAAADARARAIAAVLHPSSTYTTLASEDRLAVARVTASGIRSVEAELPELRAVWGDAGYHVELGCGAGSTLLGVLHAHPGLRAVGVEIDAAVAEELRQRVGRLDLADRLEVHAIDARDFDGDGAFDSAFWSQPCFPTETRAAVLATAYRALRPGGCLVVPLPTRAAGGGGLDSARAAALNRVVNAAWGIPSRTPEELRQEVEQGGFRFLRMAEAPTGPRLLFTRLSA
jgi:SAM-dependent methyltransferase